MFIPWGRGWHREEAAASLWVFPHSLSELCWGFTVHRHLAVHLEKVGAGLGLGGVCHLPFSCSTEGTFDV